MDFDIGIYNIIMSLGTFFLGIILVGIGVLIIWRKQDFYNYVGDLGAFFDFPGSNILDWGIVGAAIAIIGVMVSLGIFHTLIAVLIRSFLAPRV